MAVAEKVGLPNYSNVDIGPAVVERYVEDTPEAIRQGLAECALHAQQIVFTEAEEVRRRGQQPQPNLETALTAVAPGTAEVTPLDTRRLTLFNEIGKLDAESRAKVRTKLVGLGAVNVNSRAEALRSLSEEKVPELEEFLNALKEGTYAPSA
jgi:hypothetical protein